MTKTRRTKPRRAPAPLQPAHPVIAIAKALRDVRRIGVKAGKLAARFKAYGLPDPQTLVLTEKIGAVAEQIETQLLLISGDWRATKGTVGSPISAGDHVTLTKEATRRFEGIVESGQVFMVDKVVGSKLVCKAVGSAFLIPLPRSSVQREAT